MAKEDKLMLPIKYYGGKSGMLKFLLPLFPKGYKIFVDGFGGSASVLLAEERPKIIEVYNDLGDNVYSLYKCIQDGELYSQMQEKLQMIPYHERIRAEFKDDLKRTDLSLLERAYKFLYVNRTSFNGVGGFSAAILRDRNFAKGVSAYLSAIDGLENMHKRLATVIMEHKDIFAILDRYDQPDVFFYLDPPYVHSTRISSTRYEVEMEDEEHERFIDRLLTMKAKWMVSGYDHPIYERLTANANRYEYISPLSRSKKVEVVWTNYPKEDGEEKN